MVAVPPPNFRGGGEKFQAKLIGGNVSKKLNLGRELNVRVDLIF